MRKILYLHGLESPQGGKKVELLSANNLVYAPEMDYKNFTYEQFQNLLETVKDFDVVIGSSAGGWLADIIASYTQAKAILFNPAFHSRSFELDKRIVHNEKGIDYSSIIILGTEDEVINPEETKKLTNPVYDRVVEIGGMGHRTPLSVFTDIYYKYL